MRSIPTSPESGAEGVADRIVGLIEGVVLDTLAETNSNDATSSASAWERLVH